MASVTVLGSPACTDVARVLACLFENEVGFQLVRLDNFKGERKLPEFLKLQVIRSFSSTWHAPLIDEHDVDPEEIARQIEKLSDVLDLYEKRLASSEYLAGDKFTLADLTHLPNSHYLSKANVYRWWEAISSRESWRMVLQLQEERPALLEK
ncbi:unnamed protein product [Spirodela intermedia]|uniref:glutathione transferase n=1 Tax=Spirodela intermedia TaxID=51605 RepID=A0A7I8IE22_SPIIN|nr:unnamed protein product [Spirodela intermedia]CAA6656040.1 unnamed protein product [Spirodela intermedia]